MPLTRVTGNLIENATITDADISPSAAIAASKIGAGQLPAGVSTIATGSTTARSLNDRFAEIINVKDFGATGDGTTDDAPFIRNAFNRANTLGGAIVYFPLGSYNLGTFTDGTNTQPNSSAKQCVLLQNNTSTLKYVNIIGDAGTKIISGLWSPHRGVSGGSPNAAYLSWFFFEGAYGINVKNIEFKKLIGSPYSPIRPDATDGLSSYGLSNCFAALNLNSIGTEFFNVEYCTFYDFTKTIDVAYVPSTSTQYVGTSIIKNNKFLCTWGTAGTSTDFVYPTVEAHIKTDFCEFTGNYCIGGPKSYDPIQSSQSGIFQYFRPKDGTILTQGRKAIFTNNYVKNYSIENLFALPNNFFNNEFYDEHQCVISNNITESTLSSLEQSAITAVRSFSMGIVAAQPNSVVTGNTCKNHYIGINVPAYHESIKINNNNVQLYEQSTPNYPFVWGINITSFVSPAIAIQSITRSGSTATVTTTINHNYKSGRKIVITGTSVADYNSPIGYTFGKPWYNYVITVTGANTFTFQVSGTPANSTGGTVQLVSYYYEINDNNVQSFAANDDTNPSASKTTGINSGGSANVVAAKIKGNYVKNYSFVNPLKTCVGITTDTCAELIDNTIEGWTTGFLRVTGGDFGGTVRNCKSDRNLVNESSPNNIQIAVESFEFYYKPTQTGWHSLTLHSVTPMNAEVEFLVEGYSGWDSNTINPYPNFSNKLQYTKLKYLCAGGYNDSIGQNSIIVDQEHSDAGFPVISRIAIQNQFPNGLTGVFFFVTAVSTTGVIKIKTSSTRNPEYQGGGGAPSFAVFYAANDGAFPNFSDALKFNLVNGKKTLKRQGFGGFGGPVYGHGTPLYGNGTPVALNIIPEYIGQMYIDQTNSKIYFSFGTASSANWIITN
jgi:Pectate lyase superfamily protein